MPESSYRKLDSVRKLRALREREEIGNLGAIQSLLDDDINKLDMLKEYRERYVSEFADSHASIQSSESLMVQQEFIAKMEVAIKQQADQVSARNRDLSRQRLLWQQANRELKAIDNFIDRQAEQARYEAQVREQKMLDELIQMRFNRPVI